MRRIAALAMLLACKPASTAAPPAPSNTAAPPPPTTPVREQPTPTPPADRDHDGVPDSADRCPDEPEDRDQFEDDDGCVDRDNDGDGVLDAHEFSKKDGRWTNCDRMDVNGLDRDCRNQPEDIDGTDDHDGCPDFLGFCDCTLRLPEKLHFDRRGHPLPANEQLLDVIAATMQTAPRVRFWVDAHMDTLRDPKKARPLTQRMADDTVAALVRRGVARERLEPRGLGDRVPTADNRSEPGRAASRRVEFILNHDCCGSGADIRHLWNRPAGVVPAPPPAPIITHAPTCR